MGFLRGLSASAVRIYRSTPNWGRILWEGHLPCDAFKVFNLGHGIADTLAIAFSRSANHGLTG